VPHRAVVEYWNTKILEYWNTKIVFKSWLYYPNTTNCSNRKLLEYLNVRFQKQKHDYYCIFIVAK